jgi:DnaJ-domain-containing protein 1
MMILTSTGKSKEQIYSAITSSTAKENSLLPQDIKSIFNKFMFSEDKSEYLTCEQFCESLVIESKAISFISPIPKLLSSSDLKTAYRIFSATAQTPSSEIKKKYKQMALNKHPDKLSSFGIPKKYENIAAENFTRLKAAYDIIIQNSKEKS